MDDVLEAVKTERTRSSLKVSEQTSSKVSERTSLKVSGERPIQVQAQSPQEALKILKGGPNIKELKGVLRYLQDIKDDDFHIKIPSALAAQVIQVLVVQTVPDFWTHLREEKSLTLTKQILLELLRSVSGLGATLARLKALTAAYKNKSKLEAGPVAPDQIEILLELFEELLHGDKFISEIWVENSFINSKVSRRTILWKEFISIVATSRLISAVAEAEDVLQKSGTKIKGSWVAKGTNYAKWLGDNLAHMISALELDDLESWKAATGMCSKALLLGYLDVLVEQLLQELPLKHDELMQYLNGLIKKLHAHEQRTFLSSILRVLSQKYLLPPSLDWDQSSLVNTPPGIAGSAALLCGLLSSNEILTDALVELLTKAETSPLSGSHRLRRVVLSALSSDDDRLQEVAERLLQRFGDQMFVKHAPIAQQEGLGYSAFLLQQLMGPATGQLLLIACGYVHRNQPMFLFTIAKSSSQMQGVSNRLNATSPRARWLGMIISMAISALTDKKGSQLSFTDESMETAEAKWYRKLVDVNDKVGHLEDLRRSIIMTVPAKSKGIPHRPAMQVSSGNTKKAIQAPISSGPRIVEVDSDDEDDEDDIIPYAKPDSDPEDEDEDPTLIQRTKPKAPVYIRDLISGLQDKENYDLHYLALKTAASLIRRKVNFGKEVSDHAEELASILMGLNDHFEFDDFLELRQEALIAVLIAQPIHIAQHLARSCFEGDFSLQQRTSMLTALGLGARELAGYKDEDRDEMPKFPTKQLPEPLHKVYSQAQGPSVTKVSSLLEAAMVGPLALKAADQLSGPNALKVRTFSSRIAVEKARKKPITNELAKIVAQHFFFPLTGRWWTQVQAYGTKSVAFSTHLLPTYLRTLAILLHASGPSTLSLPQMTSELWDLLLSLRTSALNENDIGVLESLLFTFLTLLQMNEDKQRLATEHGKELVETQEWAKMVLDSREMGIGKEEGEGERVRMLAAAVIMRCQEVVEKWQRLMLGDMVDL